MSVLAAVNVKEKSPDMLTNRLQQPQPQSNGTRFFTTTMDRLRECGWYWGSISPEESEYILMEKNAGSFLLRDSSDDRYIFTLTVKTDDGVVHVRINQHKGKFSFGSASSSSSVSSISNNGSNGSGNGSACNSSQTVVELIDTAVRNSTDNRFRYLLHPKAGVHPAETIRLLHPVSRFSFVPSLKHTARFEILRSVRADHIDRLPLPTNLKIYLKDPKHIAELP